MEYISHDNSWFRVGVPLPPQGKSAWYAGFVILCGRALNTLRPRRPAPACEPVRPRKPRPFAAEDRRPAIVRAGEALPGCKGCSGGRRIPCANAPPLMRPAALSHMGAGNAAHHVRSISQENDFENSGTMTSRRFSHSRSGRFRSI